MFAYLEGKIAHIEAATAMLDVQGVGYEVKISLNTYAHLKNAEKGKVFTYVVLSDQTHTFSIYGFSEMAEKKVFLDLISVSGIGSNTALTMLSSLSLSELQNAVAKEDVKTIQSIKGIGPKTAQRVILELKDKFKKDSLLTHSQNIPINSQGSVRNDALAALLSLGIPKPAAEKTIDNIIRTNDKNFTTEELIKIALKSA
ncbi:MAG: Holliday junction branch migration protein RuvA [Cytophagales bacterium]